VFQQLVEKREPWVVRARRNLKDYREGFFALAAAGLYLFLWLGLPLLLQSDFNGVWFKIAGDKRLPESMRVAIKGDAFKEDFAVEDVPLVAYEHLLLRVDGKEHRWSDDLYTPVWPAHVYGEYFYTAQLNGNDLAITRFYRVDGSTDRHQVERWQITVHGRQMTVRRDGQQTSYKRASWFRSLFTAEP
jgi:hypothetical protein